MWRIVLLVGSVSLAKVFVTMLVEKYAFPSPREAHLAPSDPELVWDSVPPSSVDSLVWVPCYNQSQCARMMVPLDYAVADGPKAGVSLIKIPSKFSPGDKDYRGPILFNPGGPGGSGVALVLRIGAKVQKLVGDEYDIVGFDPRGVARTTPLVAVFNDSVEDAAWRVRALEDPVPDTTADVSRLWARAQVFGNVANQTARGSVPYVSTALVARDMLSITRAHGYDKLQYWGFSYGTILGATFAAMFPNHVERLIIDGVADAEDYYSGLWSNNLLDTDLALRMILDACVASGPLRCALYESTTDKVHTRLTAIFDSLKKRPLPVYNSEASKEYGLIDYKLAHRELFMRLHSPYGGLEAGNASYPTMDLLHALAQVEKGNGLPLARLLGIVPLQAPFTCQCSDSPRPPPAYVTADAFVAIACTDSDPARAVDTIEDLEEHFVRLHASSEFADQWPERVYCTGWKARTVERFAGPFVGNTSFPILLIGNTADPVTPLAQYARKMSRGFNNSVVLHQDSVG
ncbi:uncharacterized protein PHACADRAFT_252753, partial [Phanerochaete carnosa HHB-10118-sp]